VKALEAFVGSFTILVFSFITLPLAGSVFEVAITPQQGAGIGVLLFFARFVFLYGVRCLFEWIKR
jgi:hypothetical protein